MIEVVKGMLGVSTMAHKVFLGLIRWGPLFVQHYRAKPSALQPTKAWVHF